MLNRLGEVLLRRGLAASVAAPSVFDQRRVDDAQYTMGFAIGRLNLERLIGRPDRFFQAILAHEESGQLSHDVGGCRIQLCRAFECGDRAVDVVGGLEMPAQQELGVRFGCLVRAGRWLRSCGLRQADTGHRQRQHRDNRRKRHPHRGIVPQKGEGVI